MANLYNIIEVLQGRVENGRLVEADAIGSTWVIAACSLTRTGITNQFYGEEGENGIYSQAPDLTPEAARAIFDTLEQAATDDTTFSQLARGSVSADGSDLRNSLNRRHINRIRKARAELSLT